MIATDATTVEKVELAETYSVILHNDKANEMIDVANWLMVVFPMSSGEAMRTMLIAHCDGQAVCRSGLDFEQAVLCRDQLRSFGLTASVEHNG